MMIKDIIEKHTGDKLLRLSEVPLSGVIIRKSFPALEADLQKYMEEEMIAFGEWLVDDINPFVRMEDGRWMQACGNSTSWTTQQLLQKFKEKR